MNNLTEILLNEIKSKSQIKDLEDDFILDKLEKYFLTNCDIKKKLELEFKEKKNKIIKSKLFKETLKKIRGEIGILYGSFLTKDFPKKFKLLNKETTIENLLKLHKSSRERIEYYNQIYEEIFNWYKPKKIADLACGLNPLSYPIIEKILNKKIEFFASDLNPNDMGFLNEYFKKNNLNGIAKPYDIIQLKFLKDDDFKNCDLIFLFKALDSFEFIKKNISKEIIKKLENKKIVVSFPTKSLVSKKEFKMEKRNWFIKFLEKENFQYQTFEVENEMFFLIEK